MQNAVALGTFDGLHTGHLEVLKQTEGYNRIAVTFDAPPKHYFSKIGLLMTNVRKKELLYKLGINVIDSVRFEDVMYLSPLQFLDMVYQKYEPKLISCGFNYRFGKDAAGDIPFLENYCKEKGIILKVCDSIKCGDEIVSSTLIRSYINNGEIEKANDLLYDDFGFCSEIICGDQRGRTIGFPTANQLYPSELITPKFGVYSADIIIEGETYMAITNIGVRPTFLTDKPLCETHIIDFCGNLYGKKAFLKPRNFIRGEKKFSSVDELKKAISSDLKNIG